MTTQEIANRYMELEKENNSLKIHNELYSPNAISTEPKHTEGQGLPVFTDGLDAIKAKSQAFNEMIETVHSGYCSEPVVGGNFFSMAMGMDVTMKGGQRMRMDEIAVFQVNDGKIISEEFFY